MKFIVPRQIQVDAEAEVEADSPEEAMRKAERKSVLGMDIYGDQVTELDPRET